MVSISCQADHSPRINGHPNENHLPDVQVFQKFTNFKLSEGSESCFFAFTQSKNAVRADISRSFDCKRLKNSAVFRSGCLVC